jgi:hypothetical protein
MSNKESSAIKDRCTKERKEICEKEGKICNPENKSQNPKIYCFNDTDKNRKKIKNFDDKLKKAQFSKIQSPQSQHIQSQEDINSIKTKKTILDFIKELGKKNYKTAKDVIDNIFNDDDGDEVALKLVDNTKSKQGFIYEKLWDICIKFGITDFTKDLDEINHGTGNINNIDDSEFKKIENYIDDYLKDGYISGNSGGYSDITFNVKTKDKLKILNLVSIKYFEKEKSIDKYDIQKLCTIIENRKNEGYEKINVFLFVNDKKTLIDKLEGKTDDKDNKKKGANKSSEILIKYISPFGNYENVYGLSNLENYYKELIKILSDYNFLDNLDNVNEFKEKYLNTKKKKFIPRFHQELFIEKISDLIKKEQKKILVGAIPRSGKTFIMAGTILADVIKDKKNGTNGFNNYVIITPAPNETLSQYYKTFNDDYYDFANNDIVAINVKDTQKTYGIGISSTDLKGEENKHNVFLISKQRLGFKDKEDDKNDNDEYDNKYIEYIKKNINAFFGKDMFFKLIFFDEAHFGMTTHIAKTIFEQLDKEDKSYKIYVTATYNKPKLRYDIEDKNIIKWDLNDIKLIKNIKNEESYDEAIERLKNTFGEKILNKILKNYKDKDNIINKDDIINQYKHFPEPILLTSVWDTDFFDKELEKIGDNEKVGFNMHKLFMTKGNGSFINKHQLIQLLEYYFGYYVGDDERDKENNFYEKKYEYKKRGVIPIIEEICTNNCRTLQPQHKTTQLWFLPSYNIYKITKSLIILLNDKFEYIFNNYMFYIAVDKNIGNKDDFPENVKRMGKAEDIKSEIEKLEKELLYEPKYNKYEGLIILAGNRLQLGISLKNVDIVSLFTNISASDAIYQMLFRSMTEIEDNIECNGKNYCGRKKYGFMVDLNPQRTLYTIDYLTDMYLDYDKYNDKDKKYELIADLINIDKHKFIDKYNRHDKKGYEKYVEEFFKKLYNAWDAKTENIKILLLTKNIFNSNIFEHDYDISKLFTEMEKGKQHKKNLDGNENKFQKGAIKKKIEGIIINVDNDDKKKPSTIELWAYLFAETISILSLITSYTDKDGNECTFNIKKNNNFIYDLVNILKDTDKDIELKDIFLHTLQKRIIIKNSIKDEELYNMIRRAVDKISETKQQKGGDLLSINKQIQMRKQKIYNINELDKLLVFINDNLKPKDIEKKIRGEVFTPMKLVNEMLDTLPKEVWINPDLKWLDPAAGMGNFPIAVYIRLLEKLKYVKGYENEEKRRKHILENMLYMVELDKTNVFMMRKIFCGKIYKLNIFEGSFINFSPNKKNIFKKVNIDIKFDIILGNPPFQYKEPQNKKSQTIWHLFIKRSYEELLKEKGYLLFVHPSGWRDIDGDYREIFNYIKMSNLIYLSMNSFKEGQQIFGGSGTNFDYYLVQNIKTNNNITNINDIDNKEYKINLNNFDFVPSGKINTFQKLLTKNEKVEIIYDRSMYGTDKDNMNENKNKIYKFNCIYTITQKNGCKFWYSNINRGHFGIPKVIWSNGAGTYPIIDDKGIYGLTQFAYAIVDKKQNLQKIKDAMNNKKFIDLMKYLNFKKDNKYNYKIIALFKKDFYNDF